MNRPHPFRPGSAAALALLFAPAALGGSTPKVERQVVGPLATGTRSYLSPAGVHLATVTQSGSRLVVVYDGVAGPKFDEIVDWRQGHSAFAKAFEQTPRPTPGRLQGKAEVAFSDDGEHFAYCGRQGQEAVVVVDGEELVRLPFEKDHVVGLHFAPGTGTPVFGTKALPSPDAVPGFRLVVGGVFAEPAVGEPLPIVYSPVGGRFSYSGRSMTQSGQRTLVVDGHDAGYYGTDPVFLGDGSGLFTTGAAGPNQGMLLLDGEPVLEAPFYNPAVYTHPGTPAWLASGTGADGRPVLAIGGQDPLAGVPRPERVVFSPSGERYAAACRFGTTMSVVSDGMRGPEYQGISTLAFSADGQRLVYSAMMNGNRFVVVDGAEYEGSPFATEPVLGGPSGRVGFACGKTDADARIVIEDASVSGLRKPQSPVFSPDGARFAALIAGPALNSVVALVDGVLYEDVSPTPFNRVSHADPGPSFLFSPDGAHLVCQTSVSGKPESRLLWVDGKALPLEGRVDFLAFSPDGAHLFWQAANRQENACFVDGAKVAAWGLTTGLASEVMDGPGTREVTPEGTLRFLAVEGEEFVRYEVTPSAEHNFADALAQAR